MNRDHLGTHDSLCSLLGEVTDCDEPNDVVYAGPEDAYPLTGVTAVSLSRFKCLPQPTLRHWWIAGGQADTEVVPFVISGQFRGTTRGKVYRKTEPF
jgi:hypothetical protein